MIHLHHQNLLRVLEGNLSLEASLVLEESLHLHVSNLLHRFFPHPYEEGFPVSEVNPFLEETLALEESHHVHLHPSWEASHAWGNGLRPCLQGPKIPLSASHVLSSHLHHLHLDLQRSLMPTGGEAFVEENLPALEVNDVVSLLVLEVSLALEESDHPSIHLGRLLYLHLFQASDHSSSLLLCHHDPHPCAHCALSQAAPPPPAPLPSSSSQSPPSQRASSHTPLSRALSPRPLLLLSPRVPAAQSRLSSSAPPPPAATSSCDPPASPPSSSPGEPSSPPPPG